MGRLLVVALLLIPFAGCAAPIAGAGIRPITFPDPIRHGQTPGFVFYPSTRPTHGTTAIGPYDVAATTDAPVAPGTWPLVVISHGHGGSDLGHHDLASYLARHGFIVATFEQPGDNFHDTSGTGHASVLAGRAIEVHAVIDALLADPRWKPRVDATRIADPRVKAAFVMAPLALVFDASGAEAIDRPVDLWYAENDHVLLPSANALHLRPLVRTIVRTNAVPKADHWVFLAPCSAALAKDAGAICKDPPGVDRARVHARILADALAFFRDTLGPSANDSRARRHPHPPGFAPGSPDP